jgi:ABC-2 type transport system ATP-binding protein
VLELDGLVKRFGDVVALDGLSMVVAPGRIRGFVGRNGSGKTTAMRIAVGLSRPDAGTVRWRGGAVTDEVRRRFGYMPEERGLYPKMTTVDQVVYFGRLSGMTAAAASASAGAVLASLGLADRASEPVERLSLGNQQRAQLAAALVAGPEVLVLDEPFSGLDPVGVDVLAEVLAAQAERHAAILFSSHQLELVERVCDEVTIIDAGRPVASGTVAELKGRHAERIRIGVDGATPGWAEALPGVVVAGIDPDTGDVLVDLGDGADDQAVLAAAQVAGRVRIFARERPSLAELFRSVVSR